MDRRNFLAGMLAAAAAPAFVRVGSLMLVKPIQTPGLWDGLVSSCSPDGIVTRFDRDVTYQIDYPVDFVAMIVQQYEERIQAMLEAAAANPDGWLVAGNGCRHD